MDEPDNEHTRLESIVKGQEVPQRLQRNLLWDITNNFSRDRIIGAGGFGAVYKGVLKTGTTVAVKKIYQEHAIENKMFYGELNSVMDVKHKNIVRFLGYCSVMAEESTKYHGTAVMAELWERLLCFEYINNGSLQKYIKDEFRGLEWNERFQIIKGICDGLHYLHKTKCIIHMDLKPDNILLQDDMVPKITDFGLARPDEKSHTLSERRLTLGYCDPEYFHYGKMSPKSDIYSLGVIILELLTGYRADPNITKVLRRWRHRWNKLPKNPPLLWYRQVAKCLDLVQRCTRHNPIDRPDIEDIINELGKIDEWNKQTIDTPVPTVEIISSLEDMLWMERITVSRLDDLLGIDPLEMHFFFSPNDQIPFSIKLTNDTDDYFAFRIITTSLLQFRIEPEKGIVSPRSKLCATITLTTQDEAPLQNHGNWFSMQSFRIEGSQIYMDVTSDMFCEKEGRVVDDIDLTVVLHSQVSQRSLEIDDSRNKDVGLLESILLDESKSPGSLMLSVLKSITNDFSENRIISHGGLGVVYKGITQSGIVAVKKLCYSLVIDDRMFHQEVETIMRVKHKNIIRFLGYCYHTEHEVVQIQGKEIIAEMRERLLCMEYARNGNLADHITDELRGLAWHTRYQIIKGICEALNYLHSKQRIIHMNLKPSLILLDDLMMPKVSDFFLSSAVDKTDTKGQARLLSLGYMAPEYQRNGKISAKSDIYSLGIIIMELVTGSKMFEPNISKVLRRWRHRWYKSGSYNPLWEEQVIKCLQLAESCTRQNPMDRPNIWDIIHECNQIRQCFSDMLGIEPLEVHFPFEYSKQVSQTVQLTNDTDHNIAFRMETTSLEPLKMEPENGVVPPRYSCTVTVTIIPGQRPLRQHGDQIIVLSTKVEDGVTAKDITRNMFKEEDGKVVDEVCLAVIFDKSTLPDEA